MRLKKTTDGSNKQNVKKSNALWSSLREDLEAWVDRLTWLDELLESEHKSPRHGNYTNPMDELLYIVLTRKTPLDHAKIVFRKFRKQFRPWKRLLSVDRDEVKGVIWPLGLAELRTNQILHIANKIEADFGRVSLAPLTKMSMNEARFYLLSLPGVGEKSARCVLMYSLGFDTSPMDTHSTRVLTRLGLLPESCADSQAHKIMDHRLPPGMARRLHVNLVAHGRSVCQARAPDCSSCTLSRSCQFANVGFKLS
jgi:endonuclease III